MTWGKFYEWLGANGVKWFPGDMHYDGAGFWFPVPPDLNERGANGLPLPPPAPWIHVFKSSYEDGRKTTTTVDVSTSFGPSLYGIEDPAEAQRVVEQALMDYDTASGLGPAMKARMYPEPVPRASGRGKPMSAENLRLRDEFEAEMNKLPRNKRPPTGPYKREFEIKLEESLKRRDEMLESRQWEPARKPKGYGGIDDVSNNCDLGAHERCVSCACGCHIQTLPKIKDCTTCGREFFQASWEELPYLGRQKLEATEEEPACELEARNCHCGSTLYAEVD